MSNVKRSRRAAIGTVLEEVVTAVQGTPLGKVARPLSVSVLLLSVGAGCATDSPTSGTQITDTPSKTVTTSVTQAAVPPTTIAQVSDAPTTVATSTTVTVLDMPTTSVPAANTPACVDNYAVTVVHAAWLADDWRDFCAGMEMFYQEWSDRSPQEQSEWCEITGGPLTASFLFVLGVGRDQRLGYMDGWWNECGPPETEEQLQAFFEYLSG